MFIRKKLFLHLVIAFVAFFLIQNLSTSKVFALDIISPSNDQTFSHNMHVGVQLDDPIVPGTFQMHLDTILSGGTPLSVIIDLTDPVSNLENLNLNVTNITSSVGVVSSTDNTLPDGAYTVTFTWTDQTTSTDQFIGLSGVIYIDTVTVPPVMTDPVTNVAYHDIVPINIYLPETPSPGSAQLVFTNNVTHINYTMFLNDNTVHNFNFDFNTDPSVANPGDVVNYTGGLMPVGVYDITLSYQDAVSNPVAIFTVNTVAIIHSPAITIHAPTKTKAGNITDTTIHAQSSGDAMYAANVTVDLSNTAGYSNLNCTQTDSFNVDCTIVITGSGDLVIKAVSGLGGITTASSQNYVVTAPPPPPPPPAYIYVPQPQPAPPPEVVTVVSYPQPRIIDVPVKEEVIVSVPVNPSQGSSTTSSSSSFDIIPILVAAAFSAAGGFVLGMRAKGKSK